MIQDLEDELDLRNKVIDKLDKTRKKLGGYLVCSIIILILSCWGIYVSNN